MSMAREGETSMNAALGKPYDVFLSFRGPDTRQGFVDFLYNSMKNVGIHVYRDDDELSPGQPIETILQAIKNSRICMPIFSKDFASSAWCLREVATMLEFKREIIPIFYHVTTDDVKLKTPLYNNQMEKLEGKHGEALISQWGEALKKAVESKGRRLKDDQGSYGFIDNLLKELLIKLKVKSKHVPDHFVRMDDQINAVMKLVNVGLDDVRIVGVYGTGGIGKTTLANDIFNQLLAKFDCSCFLEDVIGELSRNNNNMEHLQKQLLINLDPKLKEFGDLTDPVMRLQTNFQKKKVLVVLDNIDHKQQIDNLVGRCCFGAGSRIIVTSRDGSVFDIKDKTRGCSVSRNQPRSKVLATEMAEMNPLQSLLLFSRHAFSRDSPMPEYEDLAKEVVDTIGGLPLALGVIGSLLRGKDKSFWKSKIAQLKQRVNRGVKENLRISFDALEISEQQIFLDIACFFINCEASTPNYMWEACNLCPTMGINALISKSLIKITEDAGVFWMHDQLRILGREIARDKSKGPTPTEYCRIYEQKEAMDMLKQKKGKENIIGLQLDKPCDTLTGQDFADLSSLRFLSVKRANIIDGFHHPLPKLKWLSLHACTVNFDLSSLSSKDLVILDLSNSSIDEKWEGWTQMQKGSLKSLDLSYCQSLKRIPTFSKMLALEVLILKNCLSLSDLTDDLGYLENLKVLSLSNCRGISRLPSSLGKLKSLVKLDLSWTGVGAWPDSFGELVELQILLLKNASIAELPETVGDLKSLTMLDLSFSSIERLPESIGRLKSLDQLLLSRCFRLNSLPESLGDLESLTLLDLSSSSVIALPASVGRLTKLEKLKMLGSKVNRLPPQIGELSSLIELNLFGAPNIRTLPSAINQLSHLETLILELSNHLRELPEELPESLTKLRVSSRRLVKVPNLFRLSKLIDLKIIDGISLMEKTPELIKSSNLQGIVNLTGLENLRLAISNLSGLPQDLSALSALRSLIIHYPSFKSIPLLPSSLKFLILKSHSSRLKLLNFSHLINLESLYCSGFIFTSISSELQLPESLTSLILVRCQNGSSDFLPTMKNLIHLELTRWKELTEISCLRGLDSLETLHIELCESLERISDLSELEKKLVKVTICCCPKLNIKPYEFTSTRFSKYLGAEIVHDEKGVWEVLKQKELQRSMYLAWWEGLFNKEKHSEEAMLNEDAPARDRIRGKKIVRTGSIVNKIQAIDDVGVHDLRLLLSSEERDFLIRNDGCRVGIDRVITSNRGYHVTLLFSASSLVDSQLFILHMKENYKDEYADVFVFVSLDEDEESFTNHFSMMPWLAIPYFDSNKRSNLVQIFKVTKIPHLVMLDERGKVTRVDLHEMIPRRLLRRNYPVQPQTLKRWKDNTEASRKNQSLRSILVRGLNDFVLAFGAQRKPVSVFEGKVIALFFSSKSTSCLEFNKRLIDVYEDLKNKGEMFEIIVCPEFNEQIIFMESWQNFFVLPKNVRRYVEMVYHFQLRSLPALVIIGRNGETLCSDAVEAVKEYGATAYPFSAEKLAEMDGEAVCWTEAAWRRQSLRSVLVRGSSNDHSLLSFDGRRRIPVTELEGKIIGLYFLHPSVSCIEFALQLLDVYEKLKSKSETFEIMSVYLRRTAHDADEQTFWGSFGAIIPFLATQIGLVGAEELISYFNISTLPALVIIGRDGKILHLNAVDVIREHGVRAYPFTQIGDTNQVPEEVREEVMVYPKMLYPDLHPHLLRPTLRTSYLCKWCNEEGQIWSCRCEECDFDLHYQCVSSKYHSIKDKSSIFSPLFFALHFMLSRLVPFLDLHRQEWIRIFFLLAFLDCFLGVGGLNHP